MKERKMNGNKAPRKAGGAAAVAPKKPPSLRQKAKALYRQAILDAAERIFATQGIRGARIQDIAKLAGMSVGTVYNHFAQKEEIVVALITEREKELREAFACQPHDPQNFTEAFRIRHERVIQLIRTHKDFFSFALYEGIFESELVPSASMFSTHSADEHERFDRAMEDLLEQGGREGAVAPTDVVRLKRYHVGAMRGVLMGAMKDPSRDVVEEGLAAVELFLRAVRPNAKGIPLPDIV
jgi:AcrR family transcriptional regulator